jgi:glycosyltransferase 2 family protein
VTLSALGGALGAVLDRVEALDARFVVPALALQLAVLVLRAVAWRNILVCACRQRISVFPVVCAYGAGVALNGLLPARGGDAAKVGLVRARVPGSGVATIAGSLPVLFLLDGVIIASLVGALWSAGAIPAVPLPALPDPRHLALALAAAIVAGVLGVTLASRRFPLRARPVLTSALQGLRILHSPWRLVGSVLPWLLGAWACRIGAIYLALGAFHIHASLATAALVVVLSGASTAIPVPGGGGSQQLLATYALRSTVPVAGALSFSFGVQLGVTALNGVVGVAAAMALFRTLKPVAALRAARARA